MNIVYKAFFVIKVIGLSQALKTIFRIRSADDKTIQFCLSKMDGIEIGGPSRFFKKLGIIPVYHVINSLDGVNFSSKTIWEGNLQGGKTFKWEKNKTGVQYIADAVDLSTIPEYKYDFVLSCNSLEHIANPIKALKEWSRVVRPRGYLLLVLPNKENNFDHKRKYTEFAHLLSDYKNEVAEDDLTHLNEILELHDLSRDRRAGSFQEFKVRSQANLENRCLHHHVYSICLLKELLNHIDVDVLVSGKMKSDLYVFGRKRA